MLAAQWRSKFSLPRLLALSIGLLGASVVTLMLVSLHIYRQLSYDNEADALAKLIGLKTHEQMQALNAVAREAGLHLQQREILRAALKDRDVTTLIPVLNGPFRQALVSSGELPMEKISLYDSEFQLVAQSAESANGRDQAAVICPDLINKARSRNGSERLKPLTELCAPGGRPSHSTLVPVGGFKVFGYVVVVSNPGPVLHSIENALDLRIRINQQDGVVVYQSTNWPEANEARFLRSSYMINGDDGAPAIRIDAVADIEPFNQQLTRTNITITVIGAFIVTPLLLLALFMSRKIGALISARDEEIRLRNETEQQLLLAKLEADSASRSKSAFLANMSHEMRTPLTAAIGFAELLLDSDQSATERIEHIHTIIRSGKHLLTIINDVLDVSKIEANKMEVEQLDFDLPGLISEVSALMRIQAEAKGLLFQVTLNPPLPKLLHSDPTRMRQILINLCSNAIKFTPQGAITLSATYFADVSQVTFKVSDTGIGMSPEQLARLFQPFAQADAGTSRQYGGTGLGLYLSRLLAEKLGGSLQVESKVGEGSEFTLTLPVPKQQTAALTYDLDVAGANTNTLPATVSKRFQGCILLAEDNPDNQRLIGLLIKRLGAQLTLAENGERAVALATTQPFDLILMDMQMPIMDGLEATRQLRAKGLTLPIVALTANAMTSDMERCRVAGCTDFLSKPVQRERFFDVVQRYLTQSSDNSGAETAPITSAVLVDDPDLEDLVTVFLSRLPMLVSDLETYYANADWPTFKGKIHELKGVGGGYGYPQITELAGKIEFELMKGDYPGAGRLLAQLKALLPRLTLK